MDMYLCVLVCSGVCIGMYLYVSAGICTHWETDIYTYIERKLPQGAGGWQPGMDTDSRVEPPRHSRKRERAPPAFTREESEAFSSYTESRVGEKHADRMLEWASNPKYRSKNLRYGSIHTLAEHAIDEFIPDGVMKEDFTEALDGSQRLIFFWRCLYDAIKELLRNARFAGKQYTHAEIKYNSTGARAYSAFNTGEVYEVGQMHAGEGVSPVPIFLSSDATLVSKKLGGHPIMRESPIPLSGSWHVLVCMYKYWYVFMGSVVFF